MDQGDNLSYVGMLMNAERGASEIDSMLDDAAEMAKAGKLGAEVSEAGEALKKAIHNYQAAVSRWLFANIEQE